MEKKDIVIVGAGGLGRVCAEVAEPAGHKIHGFADSNHELGSLINGHQCVANTFEDIKEHCQPGFRQFFVAIGDNNVREEIYVMAERLGYDLPSIIHPNAIISPHAEIGPGTVIMPRVVVNANASIGRCCIVSAGCIIDYDARIGDSVQLSPGVIIGGGAKVGAKSLIGTGASVIPGVRIGEGALIGAGAGVTSEVPARGCVAGVPARPVRK